MGEELTGGVEFEVLLEVGMPEVSLHWLDTEKVSKLACIPRRPRLPRHRSPCWPFSERDGCLRRDDGELNAEREYTSASLVMWGRWAE